MDMVKIYRVECPDTGQGMYRFMYPSGRKRAGFEWSNPRHPSQLCPSPDGDSVLKERLNDIYKSYYIVNSKNNKNTRYSYFNYSDPWYDNGAKLLSRGPDDCPWNYNYTSPWHFGFGFIHQMKAWLSRRDVRCAMDNGLVLSVYGVHNTAVAIGESQAVFFRPVARLIEARSLKRYL